MIEKCNILELDTLAGFQLWGPQENPYFPTICDKNGFFFAKNGILAHFNIVMEGQN